MKSMTSGGQYAASFVSYVARAVPATRAGRLLILMYHRVRPQPDPMFPGEVDAAAFEWQMSLLRRYCAPVSLQDGVRRLRDGSLLPRSVAVTFDDGYADNATVALPILRRSGICATFFVAPGFLDGGIMWNDAIIETIRMTGLACLGLSELGLESVQLGPEATRGAVAESIIRAVKHRPPAERCERVEAIRVRAGIELPRDLMMTSAQVRELRDSGMEVGAHTMTHPILRTLSDLEAREEMVRSQQALEAIVGHPVRAFAYPNGRPGDDYTQRDRNLAEQLGFDFAVATTWGAASGASDTFQLPRFTPWDRTPERWLARLLLAFRKPA